MLKFLSKETDIFRGDFYGKEEKPFFCYDIENEVHKALGADEKLS